jgi:hypothetical protein
VANQHVLSHKPLLIWLQQKLVHVSSFNFFPISNFTCHHPATPWLLETELLWHWWAMCGYAAQLAVIKLIQPMSSKLKTIFKSDWYLRKNNLKMLL